MLIKTRVADVITYGIKASPRRNSGIQILRAVAAVMVILYHASIYPQIMGGSAPMLDYFGGVWGTLGVSIFFVISGYLMSDLVKTTDPYLFMTHRLVRIYPTFILITLFLSLYRSPRFVDFAALSLVPVGMGPVYRLGVEWTLLFEMTFYVFLFLCSLAGIARFIEGIAVAWLGVIAAASVIAPALQETLLPTLWELPFLAANVGFAGGLLLPRMIRRGWFNAWTIALGVAAVILMDQFYLGVGGPRWSLSIVALILVGLAATWPLKWKLPALSQTSRIVERLGDWSYALYLCHVPIILIILRKVGVSYPWTTFGVTLVAIFAISVPVGMFDVALYRFCKIRIDRSNNIVRHILAVFYVAIFFFVSALALLNYR